MILKPTETISLYTKGLGYDSQILVRSPGIEEHQFHRLFLEEVAQDEFRVIKAESIPEQVLHVRWLVRLPGVDTCSGFSVLPEG